MEADRKAVPGNTVPGDAMPGDANVLPSPHHQEKITYKVGNKVIILWIFIF